MRSPIAFVSLLLVYSCATKMDPQIVVDEAIKVHGGHLFNSSLVEFDFRKKHYSVEMNNGNSIYTRSFEDSIGWIRDSLINSTELKRYVNDSLVDLTQEWQRKYSNSVNSVLYFIKLPYGLNDPAVIKEYLGEKYIGLEPYHKVKITFRKEGGGEDFEDVFVYWFHKEKKTLDFLAYKYYTDGGGTRFRQAINRSAIGGIIFQDYVNFKAEIKDAPIEKHDDYFMEGRLLELSRIVNENIVVKKK